MTEKSDAERLESFQDAKDQFLAQKGKLSDIATAYFPNVAVHEAGHAVVAYHHRYQVSCVDIMPLLGLPMLQTLGNAPSYTGGTFFHEPWPIIDSPTARVARQREEVRAAVAISGQLADQLFVGARPQHQIGQEQDDGVFEDAVNSIVASDPTVDRDDLVKSIRSSCEFILIVHHHQTARLAELLSARAILNGEELQIALKGVRRRRRGPVDRWDASKRYTPELFMPPKAN